MLCKYRQPNFVLVLKLSVFYFVQATCFVVTVGTFILLTSLFNPSSPTVFAPVLKIAQ